MPTSSEGIDVAGIIAGQRRALAKAITLVESQREDDRESSQHLLNSLLPHTGKSIRIGITGVPGVGKSTFIEAFGLHLVRQGHRVAVLAVDPSSPLAGGSILGDKTRMEALSREENAYIRPSPAGSALGGVALKTRESMLLCEAAGYDVIIVETVGVGQSEHQVAGMVDFFLLLMLPGGGDELQGIKKGILELADTIVINKADGDSTATARMTRQHYASAMSLLKNTNSWQPKVLSCSALNNEGVEDIWTLINEFRAQTEPHQGIAQKRSHQNLAWMQQLVDELLRMGLSRHPGVREALPNLEQQVQNSVITPLAAAMEVIRISQLS
ncbi:MAG: methylmalonyl Co-A mutase-associated GTPase MeaB [Halieaceae bacterium]|jgi:LAO/AO transport system kinase|nr:methylmalonyl Co-A mutase-associated GTPase MeaB [Halieaceae bacterium]MBT7340098.1 methylmalonyl Co-A mutase-associated GTPase MeaB [Halieaceae bacterium]